MKPKTIATLVVVALFIVILLQNMDGVAIELLFWPIYVPKLILITASLVLGWTVGWFTHLAYRRGKTKGAKIEHAGVEKIPQADAGHKIEGGRKAVRSATESESESQV